MIIGESDGLNRQTSTPNQRYGTKVFFGLFNVFRHFIPNIARIAAFLIKKLEVDQPFYFESLSEMETNTLETLKHRLLSPRILALPRPSGRYTLDNDTHD